MLVTPNNLMGPYKKGVAAASAPIYLPTVGAFAGLGNIDVTTLTNRTVTTSQLAGISSPSSPLKYNTLTINAGAGLNVDNSTYAANFIWVNVLNLVSATSFFNANGGDGSGPSCGGSGNGGSGGSGGGGGAGPQCPGPCPGFSGSGGSGTNGTDGDFGFGGAGLGHNYTAAFAFLNGGGSCGVCGGPGFGAGGNAAGSEIICPGCPCGGCGPIPPTYGATGGGGAGAGMNYIVANTILGGAGRTLANGGSPGLNASGNVFSFGGGGGVNMWYARHKAAGTITAQANGAFGAGNGNSSIQQINGPSDNSANSLTAKTFAGTW